MTSERRLELDLPLILEDLSMAPYPDYIDHVLAISAQRRQRPRWASFRRWLPMDLVSQRVLAPRIPWRPVIAAALVVVLLVAALLAAGGSRPLPPPFGRAANGLVAYASDGDVFLGDPILGTSRLLVGGPTNDLEPVFSRDGQQLVFMREDSQDPRLIRFFVIPAGGGETREIAGPFAGDTLGWWDWTGDGRLIAVTNTKEPGFTLIDPSGRSEPITLATDVVVDGPMVRPGGDEVVFRGLGDGRLGIYTIKLDGTGRRPIVAGKASANPEFELREPRYSPDGRLIAYHEWDPSPGVMRQFVVNADGTDRRELGADDDFWLTAWAVWSNDSTRIIVQRVREVPTGEDGRAPYAIIDVRAGSVLETGPVLPEGAAKVEWAPDDSVILMVPNDEGEPGYLLDPAGGPARRVPWDTISYPSWQRLAPPSP